MGYPQLLHLYPAEEILVGLGITPEEVEEFCGGVCPGLRARPPSTTTQNDT